MTEINNAPVPPEKAPEPDPQEAGLRAELARVRGRNKTLKIVAAVLVSMFLIIAGGGFYIYHKISNAKDAFEDVFQGFPPPAPGYQSENRTIPMGRGVYASTTAAGSGLGLFAGGLPGEQTVAGMSPDESGQILKAMSKYADRPIVKAFLADMKKNPDMAAAFSASKDNNPLKVISLMQGAKGMDKLVMKYAARPEFLSLMMEFMNDPEMRPLMRNLPGGMPMLPGMPGGAPQGGAVSVPMGQPSEDSQPADADGDGEMTFDPSVISGTPKTAPVASKKAPPRVDSGQ